MRFRPIFTVVWLSLQTAACGLESGGPAAPAGGNPPPAVPGGIASGSRLKPEFVTSADGAQIPLGSFWDAARSERCSFGADAVGVQRCMPFVGAVASYLFSDPKCMQPLFFAEPARTTCSPYGYTLQADL